MAILCSFMYFLCVPCKTSLMSSFKPKLIKIETNPFAYLPMTLLVTICLTTYGTSPPEAVTVCCGQRPQHSSVSGEPIRGQRPPQLLVA